MSEPLQRRTAHRTNAGNTRVLWGVLFGLVGLLTLSWLPLQAQATCEETSGEVQRRTYVSARLGQSMVYSVYTPPCFMPDVAYPLIYLMHGSNEDDGHWLRLNLPQQLDTAILAGELPPAVVILPFGNVIANRNRFDDISWASIFLNELLPHAEADFPAASRAIGGISRGGFWAYHIGLKRPDLFQVIGGHSAFFDRFHAPPDENPLDLVQSEDLTELRFWLDRGVDDFAVEGLDLMGERLNAVGADYQYIIHPQGEHNNAYWSQHIAEYLRFYLASAESTASITPTVGASSGFATNTPAIPAVLPTATAEPAAAEDNVAAEAAWEVFWPVVAFPSLQTSITSDQLAAVASGDLDPRLVVDPTTRELLVQAGYTLHPDTQIVDSIALRNLLWRNRDRYTLLPFDRLMLDYRLLWMDDVPVADQLAQYPFARRVSTGNFLPDALTRLTLSGVTALTRNTRTSLDERGIDWAASGIVDYVTRADFFHVSNEVSRVETCPVATGPTLGGSSSMCSRPEHLELLNLLDVDIAELTGNHNNDYGYAAYLDTLNFYRQHTMQTVGGGETLAAARQPLILTHAGQRIGWLACNAVGPYYAIVNEDSSLLGGVRPGAASCDWPWLESELPRLAASVDVTLVSVQHIEYEEYTPTDAQRFDFRRLAELGADVVIGTAPHKPQTFEFYPTRGGRVALLHYGLGNLFFDQPFWGNMRFFMDTLYIYQGRLMTVELFPGIIEELARPRLMTPQEREDFLFFMFVQQNGF